MRAWCGGTSTLQEAYQCPSHSGVLVASLVPCVCKILHPREEGLYNRWSHCTDSCHGEAASLVIECAVDPTFPCGLLYLSVKIAETLAIGNE